ncbi:restriction endonuclease PLD domain-containing protein [Halobacillus yeomjeoni]|uniref:NgoFVII family restriction endonuclease n=1 Tax=Halobacillus yeomjeoni TaxID=311194 RepID=A0A931MUI7_9BACI|nr:restriction endonuclease PLD domain-containing protein [Halobacillus yeomjeoni]MBH0230068.1 NgoFVII family restriction endonuclease [Halobacillus yeomjeoni]
MSLIRSNFFQEIIAHPYNEGRRRLEVISGYSSPSFLFNLLSSFDELQIDLTIGMAKEDSISSWNHIQYQDLVHEFSDRLTVKYYYGEPPVHSKIYYWDGDLANPEIAFIGSGNLTRNGFSNYNEVFSSVNPDDIRAAMEYADVIDCTDDDVNDIIGFGYSNGGREIDTSAVGRIVQNHPRVDLMLTETHDSRQVHSRSGLNWGHREGRERNQAYIPAPRRVHTSNPGFFPPRRQVFNIITDDGESFACVMAQENSKAIESCYDNSIIGRYFRRRLGLSDGEFITIDHLDSYGRSFVTLYKIDEETYFMDFS